MKSILPNALDLCNFGIDGVHPPFPLQGHVKARIEESDILDSG